MALLIVGSGTSMIGDVLGVSEGTRNSLDEDNMLGAGVAFRFDCAYDSYAKTAKGVVIGCYKL